MDIQLFATDEELQDFPENKIDSTVLDKTPKSNSIDLTASDLPRSHSHLPKIPLDYLNITLNVNSGEITDVNLDPTPNPRTLLWVGKQIQLSNILWIIRRFHLNTRLWVSSRFKQNSLLWIVWRPRLTTS